MHFRVGNCGSGDAARRGARYFRGADHDRCGTRGRDSRRDRIQPDRRVDPRICRRCDDFALELLNAVEQVGAGPTSGGCEALMAFTTSNGRTQTSMADINITPLVDVVLVLLIIFMVTAPVLQSGIDVSVPKTRTVKEITEERMVITINKDQRVFLGNDPININEIGRCGRRFATRGTSRFLSRR